MKKFILFWSGGKDSSLALTQILKNQEHRVEALLTIIDPTHNMVWGTGIHESLLLEQAKILKLPLLRIYLSSTIDHDEQLFKTLKRLISNGTEHFAFGFAPQVKKKNKSPAILKSVLSSFSQHIVLPLAEFNREEYAKAHLDSHHHAIVSAIQESHIPLSVLGKAINRDQTLLANDSFENWDQIHSMAIFSPHFKMRLAFSRAITINENENENNDNDVWTVQTLKSV